jgi:hypothetical protein
LSRNSLHFNRAYNVPLLSQGINSIQNFLDVYKLETGSGRAAVSEAKFEAPIETRRTREIVPNNQ